ncbi:MAG: Crp/Fnr family transcriptional regulator [Bacteroidales bacterium]|nr:Crp/Fnr family transcriptional regulator [Bacteroidales bacterium]
MIEEVFGKELSDEILNFPIAEIPAESVILREGAYIKEIPIVTKGSVKVRKIDPGGKEITLYRISPGESCILSITSCLNNKPSNAEAVIEEPSQIILIPSEKVREWMDKHSLWRKFVMKLYYDRLEQVLQLVDAIAFKQVDRRVTERLKKLRETHGDNIKITHQELANDIGTAREVVSRLLKNLEASGVIRLERGKIKIIQAL